MTHTNDVDSYRTCWTLREFATLLSRSSASRVRGLDFETAPHPARVATTSALRAEDGAVIAGISIAWFEDDRIMSGYCPIGHWRESAGGVQPDRRQALVMLDAWVRDMPTDHVLVVHNLGMELSFMLSHGVAWPLQGQLHDTQIAARVLNKGVGLNELIGLKELAIEHLGVTIEAKTEMDDWLKRHRFKPGQDIWRAPVAFASRYAQDDSRFTIALWKLWEHELLQKPTLWWWHREADRMARRDLYELEIEAGVLAVMTALRGNRIDHDLCVKQSEAASVLQDVAARWVRDRLEMPALNPGSDVQVRGVIFAEAFGVKVSLEHMTDSFKKLPDAEQAKVIAGHGDTRLEDYASLDIDALKHYESEHPEHADFFFMLAVYRKCRTALMWFSSNVEEFAHFGRDIWYDDAGEWLWAIYHRLRTVGTVSGRMSSSDFNAQQVPKRFKMLIDAERLVRILTAFLPACQLDELASMLLFALAKKGDEAKFVRVEPGARVVDFSARGMFIARAGCNQRTHDLSQVEMRGFAHYTGNKLLCEGYGQALSHARCDAELLALRRVVFEGHDPRAAFDGLDVRRFVDEDARTDVFDIHAFVGDQLGISRKSAKGINFGIVYGMGKRKLARSLGWNGTDAERYLGGYHAQFPEINGIQEMIKGRLRERGYVFDPFGRRYFLPMARSYVGLNRLIQGWAATMFKVGFVRTGTLFASPRYSGGRIHPVMRRPTMDGPRVLTCVHDELLSEIPVEHDDGYLDMMVRSSMTTMAGLKVPLGASSEGSSRSWDGVGHIELSF